MDVAGPVSPDLLGLLEKKYLTTKPTRDITNKLVMLEAVKQNGLSLKFANHILQKDRQVVMAAVKYDGFAFKYADDSIRKDEEVVLAAVKQNGDALIYADNRLKNDQKFVLMAANINPYSFKNIKIKFSDERIKKVTITGIIDTSDLNTMLNTISILTQQTFKLEGDTYTII